MIQSRVSRTDEVPPRITEISSRILAHISLHLQIFGRETKPASTLHKLPHRLVIEPLYSPRIQNPRKPHHEQQIHRTAHPPSQMAKISPGILAVIIIFSIFGAYCVVQILFCYCYCCCACSYTIWDLGLSDHWHNRRKKQKKVSPSTGSGQELESLPETARETRRTEEEESHEPETDAVSLSGVTICGNERGF